MVPTLKVKGSLRVKGYFKGVKVSCLTFPIWEVFLMSCPVLFSTLYMRYKVEHNGKRCFYCAAHHTLRRAYHREMGHKWTLLEVRDKNNIFIL